MMKLRICAALTTRYTFIPVFVPANLLLPDGCRTNYRVDRHTDLPTDVIVDAHNHGIMHAHVMTIQEPYSSIRFSDKTISRRLASNSGTAHEKEDDGVARHAIADPWLTAELRIFISRDKSAVKTTG